MRNFFTLLLVALLLGGVALAQDDAATTIDLEPEADFYGTTQWAGVSLGYPSSIYYGLNDVFGDADLRFRLSSRYYDFAIGVDALYDITRIEDVPVNVYGGGGPNIGFGFFGAFGIGLSGVIGAEYRITEEFGAFLEIGGGYTFYFGSNLAIPSLDFLRSSLGVNYHF